MPVLYTEKRAYVLIGMTGERELYDLETDPYNETTIVADRPDVAQAIHDHLLTWLREVEAPIEAFEYTWQILKD